LRRASCSTLPNQTFRGCFYHRGLPLEESSFRSRLQAVEARIQRAVERSGRERSEITLVAVTKKFSAQSIREAYEAGLRDFGENYVQEFAAKQRELQGLAEARFHLIGHLQSNKARLACELFHVIETADSANLLERLNANAMERDARVEVLLEIKLSTEQSKTGARPEDIGALMDAAAKCSQIELSGLMTMPPWSDDPEQSRPYFQQLAELGRQYGLPKLSMGMSGDLEVAIQEGATIIRVGTALFGPRPKPQPRATPVF
jgi:PLP dependent protein